MAEMVGPRITDYIPENGMMAIRVDKNCKLVGRHTNLKTAVSLVQDGELLYVWREDRWVKAGPFFIDPDLGPDLLISGEALDPFNASRRTNTGSADRFATRPVRATRFLKNIGREK